MSWNTVKYGKKRERINFAKVRKDIELPNLIEVQTKSFDWFLKEGLRELFDDISPIENFAGNLELYFGDYEFGESKYSILETKMRDFNYALPLKVDVKLVNKETGEIKTEKLFMGDFPMMTPEGTFIVNGAERVIITQIVRSAGVFFSKNVDKKSGQVKYAGQVIPTRGAWLEYEMGTKNILYAKLDRSKKIPITTLIRALGISSNEQITDIFGDSSEYGESRDLLNTTTEKDDTNNSDEAIREVYSKLRQGEQGTVEGSRNFFVSRLFDTKRYDLANVGRYKVNKKLDVLNVAFGKRLAKDLIDPETGEVILEKNTLIDTDNLDVLNDNRHAFRQEVKTEYLLEKEPLYLEVLDVEYVDRDEVKKVKLIGNNSEETRNHITPSDILASIGYYLNLFDGVGSLDDIDHLGNRRLRLIGELVQNQFRIGMTKMEKNVRDRMSTQEIENMMPKTLINIRPLTSTLREFFGSSQLSQFMDQTNPLAELTNKRRLSALGPGGLTRDRAGFEVRDVHTSHYGRICPIETPEGPNIGLINSLATYAKVNQYGFIETPYLKVDKKTHQITDKMIYLTADVEEKFVIAQANMNVSEDNMILDERVYARRWGETSIFNREEVDYVDVSPKQIVSVSTACIPFLEHDDANRALMGANMQRQAIPLLRPEAPFVGTGIEYRAAKDSGIAKIAKNDGVVEYIDAKQIRIRNTDGELDKYDLFKFMRSNQSTCINQVPIVSLGEDIKAGDIIADGPSMDSGELALGRNVVVAFMTWNGYNYEDAIVMSERLVQDDVYTSIHIEEHVIEARETKLGKEEITREILGINAEGRRYLDEKGIIMKGAEVQENDVLVGKITPKGETEPTPEERLLQAIFGEKSREVRDTSLRVPHGGGGIVHSVQYFSRKNGDDMPPGIHEIVRVYIVQKRKISEGDKMAGRHGNKGVISKILPQEDMPYMEDGTPVDIMLNPLGVPSRMNIGQILEIHLGMAAKKLGEHVATPVFDGAKQDVLEKYMQRSIKEVYAKEKVEVQKLYKARNSKLEAVNSDETLEEEYLNLFKEETSLDERINVLDTKTEIDFDGKTVLYDGRTGRRYDNRISVGVMYMIKLSHMVDDKLHARSVGPYTLVTQQPMGGKAQNGGQRFGEMEVWALEAYGAAYTLQEMLTVKSDDIIGRNKVFKAIVDGNPIPGSSIPESFRVLIKELQALGINVKLISKETGKDVVNKSLVDNEAEDTIKQYGFDN